MTRLDMVEQYIAAFNAGDASAYAKFYAPGIVFANGAGTRLTGPAAIIAYYENLKSTMTRTITVKAVVEGSQSLGAALASCFTILADGVDFAGEVLDAGDRVHLESIALYELDGDQFARIEAGTVSRRIERRAERGQ